MARRREPTGISPVLATIASESSNGSAAPPEGLVTVPDRSPVANRKPRRLPNLALLTSTIEGARVDEVNLAEIPPGDRIVTLRLDTLWLDQQPREIVPEDVLQRLIAEDRAQPSTLLEVLREVATADPYYGEILGRIAGLAQSIGIEGVLQPIQVVTTRDRYVVRDGHRRCLAALLAGVEAVPAVVVVEPSELEAVARALIVNVQREDLTALEKGAALLRLALLVARRMASEAGVGESTDSPLTLEVLLGDRSSSDDVASSSESEEPAVTTTITGRSRALAGRVRERVCAMVGLQPRSYYRLLALNRLTSEARPLARGLTENQLRPIVSLPADEQAEIVDFARRRDLSSKEIGTLAAVARSGDRDAVRRIMARLTREGADRSRTAVSWEVLLHAVPKDVWRRCQALRAELEALPTAQRQARLDSMWEQSHLLQALHAEFGEIFSGYGYAGPGSLPLD